MAHIVGIDGGSQRHGCVTALFENQTCKQGRLLHGHSAGGMARSPTQRIHKTWVVDDAAVVGDQNAAN